MQSLGPSRVSHLMRAAVVILQCFLVDCSAALQKKLDAADSALDTTTGAVRNADSSAHFPIQVPDRQAPETSKLLLFPDTESELPPPRSRDSDYGARTALAELVTIRADAELDVENADLFVRRQGGAWRRPSSQFARSEGPLHGDARLGRTSTAERPSADV
jgi:hypothetical protein